MKVKKEIKERVDLSLDKFLVTLKNPPQDVFVSVYTKKRVEVELVRSRKNKITLSGLAITVGDLTKNVNDLTSIVNGLTSTVNNLSNTVNDLSNTVNDLAKQMKEGFKKMDAKMDAGFKQVNAQIDNIEKRLDYNNLKPLPKENR